MAVILTKRWGQTVQGPTVEDMRSALIELQESDLEHPDCWLSDEEGWTLAFHEGGRAVLENVETGDGPWHMPKVGMEHALELWHLLERNDLGKLMAKEWSIGYGNA